MTTDTHHPARLLTIDEVAEWLGVTVRHIRRLVAEHRIPYLKWSRYLRFDPNDITAWLAHARVPADHPS
ncbi:MAG TPA: helix-turn-helix domain-containing protein [Ilumatobacteraceae bacterium]